VNIPRSISGHMHTARGRTGGAFTLVELLVVVSIIALLIAILLPSLQRVRQQAKTVVCLTNIKALGTGVMTYAAEYGGRLPGPLHPAVYRDLAKQSDNDPLWSTPYFRERQLTWKLRPIMNDNSALIGGVTDKMSICPVMDQIVPKSVFDDAASNYGRGTIRPVHYVINNWSSDEAHASEQDPFNERPNGTKPDSYFGYSPPSGFDPATATPPVALANISRASDEWMIADAWYRRCPKANISWVPNQEGPFQAGWTGIALPNFAPHNRKGATTYNILDGNERTTDSNRIRKSRSDGKTNTYFFDGHGETVGSKSLIAGGTQVMFYGFRGTVNDARGEIPAAARATWN
jgi:type II secretory pathway pseudopilin PulG